MSKKSGMQNIEAIHARSNDNPAEHVSTRRATQKASLYVLP